MLIYYPSIDGSLLDEIQDTFQVSQAMAIFMDIHLSSCGLVGLPVSFVSDDDQSFKNYRFLMDNSRAKAKAKAIEFFSLISRGEVDAFPKFNPIIGGLKKRSKKSGFSFRTKKGKDGSLTATVITSKTDKTDRLSFFSEVSCSTYRGSRPQPKTPKSGSPKAFFRLFKDGRIFEKNDINGYIRRSVVVEDVGEYHALLETDRFYTSLTWNRIDAFLRGKLNRLFLWPDLDQCAGADLSQIMKAEFNETGLFETINYRVGASSSPGNVRRKQLAKYLEDGGIGKSCSGYWKDGDSVERLRNLALKIAMHVRLSRGKVDQDFSMAISHWTEDLEWLREQYYEPLKSPLFEWPTFE